MTKAYHKRGNATLYGEQPHTPGDWTLNGDQLIALHTDEDGDHETLIADIFTEHDWWKANARLLRAAPDMLDALLDAKRYLEKAQDEVDCGDNEVENVSFYVNAALDSVMKGLTMGG